MLIGSSKLLITGIIIILFQMTAFGIGPWELKYPNPVYDFTDLAENDSTIVVTGLKNAMFVSSHDTIWNEVLVDGMPIMRSIIRYKDRFVSVGDSGAIYSSVDGRQWTRHTSGVTVQLSCIYGDTAHSLLIAVGLNGTLLKSTDGETWNIQSCDLKSNFRQVLYDGRDWVIVANVDTILYSANANEWVVKDVDSTSSFFPIKYLASNGMKLLAISDPVVEGIFINSATDCANWNVFTRMSSTARCAQCFWEGKAWIITCDEANYLEYSSQRSIDLVTWKAVSPQKIVRCAKFDGRRSLYITRNFCEPFFSNVMADSVFLFNPVFSNHLNASSWDGNTIVVVGNSGFISTTVDCSLWKNRLSPTNKNINGVTWNGTKFIAVGDSGTIISSADGTSWSAIPCSTSNDLIGILSTPDINVAYGKQVTLSSTNGIDWNVHTFDTTVNIFKMIKTDTLFIGVSPYQRYVEGDYTKDKNMIVTSKNGTEWVNYYQEGSIKNISYSEKFGIVEVIYSRGKQPTYYCAVPKLKAFNDIGGAEVQSCYGGPGNIVVTCQYNKVLESNDGVNWNQTSLPYSLGSYSTWNKPEVHDIHYANSHYVAVGTYGRIWAAKGDANDSIKIVKNSKSISTLTYKNVSLNAALSRQNSILKVTYTLPTPQSVEVGLYNLNGKRILVCDKGFKHSGTNEIQIKTDKISAGNYLLRLKTDKNGALIKYVAIF